MIYSILNGFENLDNFDIYKSEHTKIYFKGLFYMLGYKAGKESIANLVDIYEKTGSIPYIDLFGAFSIIIENNKEKIFFTDNSNMHCFYLSKNYISDRALPLIKKEGIKRFDDQSLCEFFSLGSVYFGKTLIKGVNISSNYCYYKVESKKIYEINKSVGDIDGNTKISSIQDFFDQLAFSLRDEKITMSLTGGYDSRMVFSCLNKKLPFNTFVSGDNLNAKEIIISEKVAYVGNCPHDKIIKNKMEVDKQYLIELFYKADGLAPFISDGHFRIDDYIENRKEKGYSVLISGNAGDMHKDWWYTQDLPFYKREKTNFSKFYDLRIEKIKYNEYIGEYLQPYYKNLKHKYLVELNKQIKKINTKSYDSYGFNINWHKAVVTFNSPAFDNLVNYAPLLELEVVRYSYHLPRSQRFFCNSMRKVTTKADKEVAKIPTVYGTTSSSEFIYICRDTGYHLVDLLKKILRTIGRKLLKKSFFVNNVMTWSAEDSIRSLPIAKEAINFCIMSGYIIDSVTVNNVKYGILCKAIQIYLLKKYMEDEK